MTGPTVHTLASRQVYANQWMTVREDDVRHADGGRGRYGVVDKPDFALIVPRDEGRLHLVEQYRYPVGGRYWEFPQGSWPTRDHDPTPPVDLARNELREETGMQAEQMTYLGRVHVAYGYANQGCHVFLAERLRLGRPQRESTESDMRQRWVDTGEFHQMVRSGLVTDAATLAAVTLVALWDDGALRPGPSAPGDEGGQCP
ncbi:NUDIX hydrolase [Micromonospora schwarzwaldensis]|uniref:NUDIX hydrolase n=1 Tax=Micromonospora sp. DSM 45708 TaxID=3111767 RepID=UPI0031CE11DA